MILDAILPDTDGPLLARQIRANRPNDAFIAMISHIGSKVGRDRSVTGWLSKPVKPRQLKRLLINLISPRAKR